MNAKADHQTQVVIVGGGPVGLGLAIDLGLRGIRCVLVEKYKTPQPIPKGQNLTQRTLEHFHFWGAEPELRAARTIPRDYGIGGMTAYGTLLSGYKYDWLQRELVRPFYFTDNERLPQYATEAVLRQRLDEIDQVQTLYGWSADSIVQDDDGVEVTITARDGGAQKRLRARYVVGCDGSRSIVREAAGITQTKSDHDRLMVLLVFRSEQLHHLLERFPNKSFYNVLHPDLKGYWKFFGRVDLGATWFFHAPVPFGTTKDNFDFRSLLHGAVGDLFDVRFEHIGFWDLRVAMADRYRNARIFEPGVDAVAAVGRVAMRGIARNEDAANLGWKFAAQLQGWAGAGLLDTYDEERRPVFASTARDFIETAIDSDREFLAGFDPAIDQAAFDAEWQARSSGARAEVNSFEPNYEGGSIIVGTSTKQPSAIGSHEYVARAGHHLTPRVLSSGRNVFDELGKGFTLLALGADTARVRDIARAAQARGVPLEIVADDARAIRDFYGADLVLVRPDQFVAWISTGGVANADDIIRRVVGGDPSAPPR